MDRIPDSGSDDWGSTPHGCTKKPLYNIPEAHFAPRGCLNFHHAPAVHDEGLVISVDGLEQVRLHKNREVGTCRWHVPTL